MTLADEVDGFASRSCRPRDTRPPWANAGEAARTRAPRPMMRTGRVSESISSEPLQSCERAPPRQRSGKLYAPTRKRKQEFRVRQNASETATQFVWNVRPIPRPAGWLEFLNSENPDETADVRRSISSGEPYGSPGWVDLFFL